MRVIDYGRYSDRITSLLYALYRSRAIALSQNSAEVSIQAFAIDQCAEKAVVARILHAYWNATDGP